MKLRKTINGTQLHRLLRHIEIALTRLADRYAHWFSGASLEMPVEVVRKRVLIGLGFLVAMPILLISGVVDLASNRIAEGTLAVGLFLSIASIIPGFRQITHPRPLFRFLLVVFALLVIQGFVAGGLDGSKSLWMLVFPPIVMFLCGRREGLLWSLGVITIGAAAHEILPDTLRFGYAIPFKIRMTASYLAITMMTYALELVRAGARHRLEQEQSDLRRKTEMLSAANAKIRRMSRTDALTRCYNRGYLNQHLPRELARCRRYRHALSIILCDLDRFKNINDQYGHQFGDTVLRQLVLHLSGELRGRVDWLARYGGEEFLIVLPETPEAAACRIAERLRRVLAEDTMVADGKEVRVTASFGVAGWDPTDEQSPNTAEALIRLADDRLYEAKRSGRNRVMGANLVTPDRSGSLTLMRPDSSGETG